MDRQLLRNVGVIGGGFEEVCVSVPGEIVAADQYYSYAAKYENVDSQTIVPADLPDEKAEEIRGIAAKIFKAVNGRGLARVDFFIENDTQKVFFNEINTMPGFTGISMFPKVWEACGLPMPELIDRLIISACI